MRCGRVRLTLFFPLHNSNFLYQIENVVCYPFRTANLVDNGTKEDQIGEGCLPGVVGQVQLLDLAGGVEAEEDGVEDVQVDQGARLVRVAVGLLRLVL